MTKRPGLIVVVRQEADGTGATMGTTSGYSPTAYMPLITAEVRLHWPPRASKQECLEALQQALEDAKEALEMRHQGE